MIKRLYGNSILRLFSASVVDQAILSLANLTVVVLLIRHADASEYGRFVLVQVTIALLTIVQGSWVCGPLTVLAPQRSDTERDALIGEVQFGLLRFIYMLLPVSLVIAGVGIFSGLIGGDYALLVLASIFVGALEMYRDFLRDAMRIRFGMRELLIADAAFAGLLVGGALLIAIIPQPTALHGVLVLGTASVSSIFLLRRMLQVSGSQGTDKQGAAWLELRPLGIWATAGASIYWVQTQTFNYALAARLSEAAVGHVNSARLMVMPVFLLCNGVASLLLPSAARWLHLSGLRVLVNRLILFVGVLLVLDLIYLVVLWLARDWITGDILRIDIPDRDLLLMLWATNSLISMVREMFQAAVLALKRFKEMAWLSLLAAIATLLTMWVAISKIGAPGAVAGTTVGELVNLIGIGFLLAQSMRHDKARQAAAATSDRD